MNDSEITADMLFLPPEQMPGASLMQNVELLTLNNQYGVEMWKMKGDMLFVECSDGDTCTVTPSGTRIWDSEE